MGIKRFAPAVLAALFAVSSLLHAHAHGHAADGGESSHACPLALPAVSAGAAPAARHWSPVVFLGRPAVEAARPASAPVVPPPSRAPPLPL